MRFLTFFFLFLSLQLSAETDFEKAEKLFRQQKYQLAKDLFENVLKTNPKNYRTIEYLGDIASHQNRWDAAIVHYKNLKDQFPNSANYQYKLGGALAMKAKTANTLKALTLVGDIENAFLAAARLDPNHIDTRWALVIFYIQLPGIAGGSENKATRYSNQLMVLSKVDGYLSKAYIDEYFNRTKNAEINYIKAHEIGNSKTTSQKLHAFYLNKLKDLSKANKLKEQFNTTQNKA